MPQIEQARAWYPANDPVHGFDHVLRVLRVTEEIGSALGADLAVLRAAALLHDAAGAYPGGASTRGNHEMQSAAFARSVLDKEGWEEKDIDAVEHCILTHRFRNSAEPGTLEAQILFDADKLDVLGAFGVARTIGYALQAGQPIYTRPSARFLESGEKEEGEPHSAYHEYLFKLRHVRERLFTEPARAIAERRHALLCEFFDALNEEASEAA